MKKETASQKCVRWKKITSRISGRERLLNEPICNIFFRQLKLQSKTRFLETIWDFKSVVSNFVGLLIKLEVQCRIESNTILFRLVWSLWYHSIFKNIHCVSELLGVLRLILFELIYLSQLHGFQSLWTPTVNHYLRNSNQNNLNHE